MTCTSELQCDLHMSTKDSLDTPTYVNNKIAYDHINIYQGQHWKFELTKKLAIRNRFFG